ncbi:outer membrane beta-barrel protein [Thalassotalea piscium]
MFQTKAISTLVICLGMISTTTLATDFEIIPFVGQMTSSDLSTTSGNDMSLSTGTNVGVGIAWQDTSNGQGQVLVNYVSHDFDSNINQEKQSLDILYTHFNGIAQFRQQNYLTTLSLGIGGAYFKSDYDEELYASATIAVGTQYAINDQFSFVTELRGYATLVDEDDELFCDDTLCHAQFEDSLFMEANISIGVAYKF